MSTILIHCFQNHLQCSIVTNCLKLKRKKIEDFHLKLHN